MDQRRYKLPWPTVLYASMLYTTDYLVYVQSLKTILGRWRFSLYKFVRSIVSCFCMLEDRNESDVGMMFQELC